MIDAEKRKEYDKKYRENNKEKRKVSQKKYYDNNKEKISIKYKEWNFENKEIKNQKNKEYNNNNKEKINIKRREREILKRKTNPLFKLKNTLRRRIFGSLKAKSWNKRNTTKDFLGCEFETVKIHLENQFVYGMNWHNHGLFGWHIDHIIPLSSAKTEEELYKLCHYTNLQPLWAEDNLKKSDKINY